MKIASIRVDHIEHHNTVESEAPVISWIIEDPPKESVAKEVRVILTREADGQIIYESGAEHGIQKTEVICQGAVLASDCRYLITIRVKVCTENEVLTAEGQSYFETGLCTESEKEGGWIGETDGDRSHLFRRDFRCDKEIADAKLYVCGLGHYRALINGQRESDYVLEPGWSDYRKRCFYVASNVTDLLKEGDNALLFRLGGGMFHVPEHEGRYVYYPRSYGFPKLWARLRITYADGTKELVTTDEHWMQRIGPDLYQEMYGGSYYDARRMKAAYADPDIPCDETWERAPLVPAPEGKLVAYPAEHLKVMEELSPVRIIKNTDHSYLYDFGTNFTGRVRIKVAGAGASADPIVLTPGELLKDCEDGVHVDQSVTGRNYHWIYQPDDSPIQEYAPDFTYTGFRYLEVEGALPEVAERNDLPKLLQVVGEFIYPEVRQMGSFRCSEELFNQIHRIIRQAILSNTKSYFTDCPHRERLGWLEQTHLIGPSIMYQFDAQSLYTKILQDMADAQHEDGLIPDICPEYVTGFDKWHTGFVDSPEWGSACILDAWYLYLRSGDATVLGTHYDTMRRYVNYLTGKTHHHVLHHGLGDWLDIGPNTPHSQNTPISLVGTCIYYKDVCILRDIATLLGKMEDVVTYADLAEEIYREYQLQFYDDQTGRYATGSQAAQAMSLMCGLVEESQEARVLKVLREDIEKRGYATTAGDVGHPFVVAALMKYGMDDLLDQMIRITDKPGYGYQVVHGATTLTEEWDGPDPAHPHGSQNHLMLGSIEEWFFGGIGGMEWIKGEGNVAHLRIKPYVPAQMDFAEAVTNHPGGTLSVRWDREGSLIRVQVQIPFGIRATLCDSNGHRIATVGCGRHEYSFTKE
ncbi:MAG: glycoside hydrolase family 78 protein [Lachnospiraceae bacterium]|nr:glycoside hydrolase family 78 protein [Lachnospiraceae bacterium]